MDNFNNGRHFNKQGNQNFNNNNNFQPRFGGFNQNFRAPQNFHEDTFGPPPAFFNQNQRNFQQNQQNSRFQRWPRPPMRGPMPQGFMNNQQPRNQKKKRPHEEVDRSGPPFSPSPKRQFQRPNSFDGRPPMLPPATPQQMQKLQKKSENHPAKMEKAAKEREWNDIFHRTLSFLHKCQPGQEINVLLKHLQPPRNAWNHVKDQIYSDMMKVMGPLGISTMLVFGSTLTGLDFIGSDLDYHISLQNQPKTDEDVKNLLAKALKMFKSSPEFSVVFSVNHARVPIIKVSHAHTRVSLDVNFTSPFGYWNSKFIATVLAFDSRVKNLAVLLKLWSKSTKISEKMVMSNYCLVNLLFFYLQNLPKPMLDSIKNNQLCGLSNILDEKFKWNFFFNDKINKTKQNTMNTRQLLEGFFDFYNKINYQNYILSIHTGELIERKDFDNHPDMEFYRKTVAESQLTPLKHDKPETFIVQDGFELNLNIGIKSKKHCETFFATIKASAAKCEEMKKESFGMLLVKLYTDLKIEVVETKSEQKGKKKFQMTIHSIAGDMKLCQDILVHKNPDQVCSEQDQQNFFFEHVFEGTKRFLETIYLCKIVESPEKSGKEFKIVLDFDTVNGRKKMVFKDEESLSAEAKLSSIMKEKKVQLDLAADVKISTKDEGKTVDIEMNDSEPRKKSALPNFGTFFAVNIPTALKYYLKTSWDATQ